MSIDRLRELASLALPVEKRGAKYFYHEAHRFAGWLSGISGLGIETTAKVIAALSPRNNWDDNQLDAIALCVGGDPASGLLDKQLSARDRGYVSSKFGYGAVNRDIALAQGVVDGTADLEPTQRKSTAFYLNILYPEHPCVGIPVDIHLSRALYGLDITDRDVGGLIGTESKYAAAEQAIVKAALASGYKPIEFANLLWFVCRRLKKDRRQHSFDFQRHDWRPEYPQGEYRLSLQYPARVQLLPGCSYRPWLLETEYANAQRWGDESIAKGGKGWVYVHLGRDHPHAMSNGRATRARLVVEYELGRRLRYDEHVHHGEDGITCDELWNLEIVTPEYHGRIHGSAMCVARCDKTGRFRELDPGVDDVGPFYWARNGAELGERAGVHTI